MASSDDSFDIIVAGAGPVGLSFAASLAESDLKVAVVEQQALESLAKPPFDGREIALTFASISILRELGAWDAIPAGHKSPVQGARVLNGSSPFALCFDPPRGSAEPLGFLVPNCRIRDALFKIIRSHHRVQLLCGHSVVGVTNSRKGAVVKLSDGRRLTARLFVAADSRLSRTRDLLGIAADINRLGSSMVICRVRHERAHHQLAIEWFDHHQTIAILPLMEGESSLLLTLRANEANRLLALDDDLFLIELTDRCRGRLGKMTLASKRHIYPLVTTWAHSFWAPGAALIGDAAVGMHPVTAHGFNIGLCGQKQLARRILTARGDRRDIADPDMLHRYESCLRLSAAPLYHATNLLVGLYSGEHAAARFARHVGLRLAQCFPFVRHGISVMLRR
ncbi:5-demethoxyubiquinol-8 5-hydroxylase UbiM [Mesorhizobium humile]|uniref:5-demethoxyubiquinol-8 5-hydroxylase UbiM n=1 Tax=Mesorhizobium humile TaxID=3072313 RepID=A0ABU4YM39_9HYPH|nr:MULTISPECIES: 5-demethoxyubiquinol-8 5-hydroxylase UbiM [unclassified Mesorhizobium]MDX8457206.1 5-demethoxyubiquinol-8 5-hydroxylase UbiM [Mesorhizobium sp. VK2D]MDX8486999.1 5-demethoxyubiquinol-8 5-hydroxylase UbiM [Mesorhizobium sp. VK2B]